MYNFIGGLLVLLVGKFLYNENEKLKYKRYKKEKNASNVVISKIYKIQNQILNDINNQTKAAVNVFTKKKNSTIYLTPGDHIAIDRYFPIPYSHHGIFVGNNQVIHYTLPGIIKLTNLSEFRDYSDGLIYKIDSISNLSPEHIIKLAYSKIGEKDYDFVMNNCETFARWCRYGN